jgi:adenylate cyclase
VLNAFLSRMGRAIERERGIVDKYVGDEIMAVFGAPLDLPDHAERAVAAGLAMIAELEQFNAERAPAAPLRMGVGIATGTVIAGNVGSSERLNYTVLGDVVNLAARLEALTKEHGVPLLMNETTHAAVQVRFADAARPVTVRRRADDTVTARPSRNRRDQRMASNVTKRCCRSVLTNPRGGALARPGSPSR